jgi:hypothetical protein
MLRLVAPLAALTLLTACTAPEPKVASTPEAPAPAAEAPTAPPPGAAGKLSPEMVGKVSPVPAFRGLGEHFNIQITSAGEMRHTVALTWGTGTRQADGEVFWRGAPGPKHDGPIALDGTLMIDGMARRIDVQIIAEPCTDEADQPHTHRVVVKVDGEGTLNGCGDLAVY